LLAVAAIYDGAARTQAAEIAGVTLQIIRDWVVKFNASGPEGLIDRKAPGRAPRLSEEHREALAAMIESGPFTAWRPDALSISATGCLRSFASRCPNRP
jgi:transposase